MVDRKERKSVFLRRYLSPLPKLKSLLAPPRGNKISTCCCPGLSVLAKDPRRRGECRFLFYYLETARETDPSHGRSQRFSFSLPLSFSFYGLEWFCSVLIEEEEESLIRQFEKLVFFFASQCPCTCVRFLCYPFRGRTVENFQNQECFSFSRETVDFIIFLEVK